MGSRSWSPTPGAVWGCYDGPDGADTLDDDDAEWFTFCGVGRGDGEYEIYFVFNRVFNGEIYVITERQFLEEVDKWKRIS